MSRFIDKRIAVTGGAGFLGRHVVAKLAERGCKEVTVVRSRDYDLTTWSGTQAMYRDCKPQIVIHLAAVVGGIGANRDNPGRYFYDNLMMGAQLLELGRQSGVEKIVAIGTVCSYPKYCPVPFKEENIWAGYPEETNAPYGIAKKAILVQSQAYRQQYGLNSIFLIPVNLYGPGDNFDLATSHVIPALIRKCVTAVRAGESAITLWGDGSASREFLFVEDAAAGIVMAAENYNRSDPVNLGTGREITIQELAKMIASCSGFTGKMLWDSAKPNGQPRRVLDTTRAKEAFGFTATTALEEGLRRTVEWYKSM